MEVKIENRCGNCVHNAVCRYCETNLELLEALKNSLDSVPNDHRYCSIKCSDYLSATALVLK